jgi:SAM-dependent methyltransferase
MSALAGGIRQEVDDLAHAILSWEVVVPAVVPPVDCCLPMQSEQFQLHADIEERHWWFVGRRRILTSLIEAVLPPSRNATIVDVGCGTGANLAGLANRYDCVGIDSSSHAIRLARIRFPKIRFLHGLAPRDLDGVMDRARLVLLTDVLEHVDDDFALLSELLASARSGTYFLLTVPADLTLWSEHDTSFGHYRRYDRERFEQLWRGLAVKQLFASHYNSRLYPAVKLVRRWNRRRGRAGGVAGTDFAMPNRVTNALLTRLFSGESRRLVCLARGESRTPYRHGVSLIALLQREAGPIVPRCKPLDIPLDYHDPAAQLVTADV